MNREILFRAKLKEDYFNKGWQYGLIYRTWFSGSIFKYWLTPIKKENLTTFDTVCVNPETICQYTGLVDKNGTKIFENDILQVNFHGDEIGRVRIYYKYAMYLCDVIYGDIDFDTLGMLDANYQLEVIGNVYDNPEMVS